MSTLNLPAPEILAIAVADTLAVASDPQARHASIFYWERGRAQALAVVKAVAALNAPAIQQMVTELLEHPEDPGIYFDLKTHLLPLAQSVGTGVQENATEALFAAAWQSECISRLGYHLGSAYEPAAGCAVLSQALHALPPGISLPEELPAPILIVIPFRDRNAGAPRLRNLLACLLSLRDQSAPRASYRVVVVESDDEPRCRDIVAPWTDRYLFAPKAGLFNKSWAINVGVIDDAGAAELICILDADVLVDRDFVARNVARFQKPGAMGHLTYRDMWNLDEASTSSAIKQRIRHRAAEVDPDALRAFVLRRPPGACVWVRLSSFHAIGGMDERFEGWGGEDNDFVYRLDMHSAFDSYNDPLLHMYHPPTAALRDDGELLNAHIPGLSWQPGEKIGDLLRFAATKVQAPHECLLTNVHP